MRISSFAQLFLLIFVDLACSDHHNNAYNVLRVTSYGRVFAIHLTAAEFTAICMVAILVLRAIR